MTEYKKINTYGDIVKLIYEFKDVFPNITASEQIVNNYAAKFCKFAQVIKLTCNKETAGMAVYYANDFEKNYGYISLIGLKKEFRGKHLGKNLLEFVLRDMRALNMEYVRLECADVNVNAYQFYCKMGFKTERRAGKESFYMIRRISGWEMK